ncbi:malonate--CoA ligase [Pseudohoeflea coraliihabitans]|uniref:Malonyl-CoA synthase n=1 Tax=Pseudohoeflea coraliihabitans TaxID=2860393 RepID=A0ABS6WKT9_9HYPH|nr:malonyl-CoA synthase [Pseudohoeflea sp. DP4N28-3]MBW3096490.1 malonyl-CoA synthase [Pseudohoeflea sp. DP4N28-3]
MTNMLYDTLLGIHAGRDTPFLHLPGGETLTHAGFVARAGQMAAALSAAGLEAGDRVAAQVEKSADALALYAGCVQAGLVFLPLNVAYTRDEVSYFIEDSGARMLVCDPGRSEELAPIAERHNAMIMTLDAAGGGSLPDRALELSPDFAPVARSADDLAALLYTSGTTGRSKGAMLSHGNLVSNAETLAELWQFSADDVLLHALPIFHTHGLFVATNTMLVAGGSMILLPKFDLDAVVAALPRATTMMGVPTFYTRLLSDPRLDQALTERMRLFISGSAPLLADTHERFAARTGHRILERYGMTETNMNTFNPYEGERRAGTVGMPLPGVEVKITDPESGDPVEDGAVGMIEVRGPNVFSGYWNMPEKTAEELRENGFFITGDLGRIDADGYVHIVGRGKDLIISGGYNVYPKEVELVLDAQKGVLESAVIGVPHPDFGEAVVGVLVPAQAQPADEQDEGEIDTDAILAECASSLARYKHPSRFVVVDALPRNAMGKVQKSLLRERFRDLFAGFGAMG